MGQLERLIGDGDSAWDDPADDPAEVIDDMHRVLGANGLMPPAVPRSLVGGLRTSADGWAWGTDPWVDPWNSYFGPEEREELYCHPGLDDFWMWAYRGYGTNSFGGGVVSRIGPLFVAVQTLWGGAYTNQARSTFAMNLATIAWNRALERLEESNELDGPPRVSILWSDFRGHISMSIPNEHSPFADPNGFADVFVTSDRDRHVILRELREDPDPAVVIGAELLLTLLVNRG